MFAGNECTISITENSSCGLSLNAMLIWCVAYHVACGATVRTQALCDRHRRNFDTEIRSAVHKFGLDASVSIILSVYRRVSESVDGECVVVRLPLSSLRDTCIQFINLFLYIFMRCKYSIMCIARCLCVTTVGIDVGVAAAAACYVFNGKFCSATHIAYGKPSTNSFTLN